MLLSFHSPLYKNPAAALGKKTNQTNVQISAI
jgi:hypothetical protein